MGVNDIVKFQNIIFKVLLHLLGLSQKHFCFLDLLLQVCDLFGKRRAPLQELFVVLEAVLVAIDLLCRLSLSDCQSYSEVGSVVVDFLFELRHDMV